MRSHVNSPETHPPVTSRANGRMALLAALLATAGCDQISSRIQQSLHPQDLSVKEAALPDMAESAEARGQKNIARAVACLESTGHFKKVKTCADVPKIKFSKRTPTGKETHDFHAEAEWIDVIGGPAGATCVTLLPKQWALKMRVEGDDGSITYMPLTKTGFAFSMGAQKVFEYFQAEAWQGPNGHSKRLKASQAPEQTIEQMRSFLDGVFGPDSIKLDDPSCQP